MANGYLGQPKWQMARNFDDKQIQFTAAKYKHFAKNKENWMRTVEMVKKRYDET